MEEVTEILQYLNAHPTESEILAAVYEVRTPTSLGQFKLNLEDFEKNFNDMPEYLGQPEKAPNDFMANIEFAKQLMDKMKLN